MMPLRSHSLVATCGQRNGDMQRACGAVGEARQASRPGVAAGGRAGQGRGNARFPGAPGGAGWRGAPAPGSIPHCRGPADATHLLLGGAAGGSALPCVRVRLGSATPRLSLLEEAAPAWREELAGRALSAEGALED